MRRVASRLRRGRGRSGSLVSDLRFTATAGDAIRDVFDQIPVLATDVEIAPDQVQIPCPGATQKDPGQKQWDGLRLGCAWPDFWCLLCLLRRLLGG